MNGFVSLKTFKTPLKYVILLMAYEMFKHESFILQNSYRLLYRLLWSYRQTVLVLSNSNCVIVLTTQKKADQRDDLGILTSPFVMNIT